MDDVRFSLRTLLKHPAFTAAGVIVLGLGIGVNTAIFSLVNAILYRPLPVRDPGELRYLYSVQANDPVPYGRTTYSEFVELRDRNTVFAGVAALSSMRSRMRIGNEVEVVRGEAVSPSYFETLGVFPAIGRGLARDDEPATAEPVALISDALWRSRYNADPAVVGRTLALNRSGRVGSYGDWKRYTIVGVMPAGFRGISSPWEATQFWIPGLQRGADIIEQERARGMKGRRPEDLWVLPIARLKPGVTTAVAVAEVEAFAAEFRARSPVEIALTLRLYDSRRIQLPFDPAGRLVPERLAAGLMAVSGVLLLIAAANLGGMLIARGVSRRGEITLRLTLGAGTWRLARQLLTETLMLAAAGGVLGLLLARWLIDLFVAGTPTSVARWQISAMTLEIPIDARVLAFTASSCLLTGLVVGLAPVLQAVRTDPARGLAGAGMGSTRPARSALRHWIVVPQVCLSFVLLIAAGLLVKTLLRSELMHPGYDAEGVVLMDFAVPQELLPPGNWTREIAQEVGRQRRALHDRLLGRLRSSGRFSSVTITLAPAFAGHGMPLPSMRSWIVRREGYAPGAQHFWTSTDAVAAGYFDTLKIPIIHGRALDGRDRLDAPRVAVVSEQLARWAWPGRNPVGEYFGLHDPESTREPQQWIEIVGVVGDVDPPLSDGWRPAYYTPAEQQNVPAGFTVVARGEGAPADLLRGLKTVMAEADATIIATNGRTLEAAVGEMLYPRRAAAAILGIAGVIGLILASAGLYGVVSFSVAQRVREIGVRMALGAERPQITRMILREGFVVIGMGLVLGTGLAYAAIRLTSRLVAPLPPADTVTLLAVPAALSAVILLACYVPAVRASRVNPIEVLRAL